MANRYVYYDFGRWESFNNNIENSLEKGSGYADNPVLATLQKSADFSHGGLSSGKLTFKGFKIHPTFYSPNLYFPFIEYTSGPKAWTQFFTPGVAPEGSGGKDFLLEAWIYTPSSNPIGSDDLKLQFGPQVYPFQNGASTWQITPTEIVSKTVAECKDQWVKISYKFRFEGGNAFFISLYASDASLRDLDLPAALDHNFQGTLNIDGVLYIDDVVLTDLSEQVCDLAFSSPAYTKTNETAVDANDGTITINATSSYTRQYSLDGVAWQASNFFSGVAPGSYTVYVRDTNPLGCGVISQAGVVIAEFEPVEPPPPPVPGPLEVDAEPVNLNNFISWFASDGPTNFTEIIFSNCCWDFANAYRINKRKRKHYPVVCNNEEFTFYINFEEPYTDPNFADFRLDLINNVGVVQSNIGPLNKQDLGDGVYNIYSAVTLVGVPIGKYRLAIRNATNDAIVFISNELEVMSLDDAKCYTTRVQFRASFNMYRYFYLIDLDDFLNTIRLRLYKVDQQSDGTLAQYRAVSSGRLRNVSLELDRLLVFESYFFDDLANRAMEIFAVHDTILLNTKPFIAKGLFKADYVVSNNVNKGRIEMYDQEFSTQNRYGNPNGGAFAEAPDALLGDDGDYILL